MTNLKYHLTLFPKQNAGPGQLDQNTDMDWDTIVQFLSVHESFDGDKSLTNHFNGVRYSETIEGFNGKMVAARRNECVVDISLLVLDFDDVTTIEEAKELYKDYSYVLYSSYNHQRWKGDQSPRDKFRVVIPLTAPVAAEQWQSRIHNLNWFAPNYDPASKTMTQPFCTPIQHPNEGEAVLFTNSGKTLDMMEWEEKELNEHGYVAADATEISDNKLTADTVIRTKNGNIILGDVPEGITQNVYCPLHADKTPGAFVTHSKAGNIAVHCNSGCGKIFMERDIVEDTTLTFKSKGGDEKSLTIEVPKKKVKVKKPPSIEQLLEFTNAEAVLPFSRKERVALALKKVKQPRKRTLLYAAEGFGKSHLATTWAMIPFNCVVFGCISNAQAEEQAQGFENVRGLTVQLLVSRSYMLGRDYGVSAIQTKPAHPWDTGDVDEELTMAEIMKVREVDQSEAKEIWDACATPQPDFHNHDMVVTTHTRLNIWGRQQKKLYDIPEESSDKERADIILADLETEPRQVVPDHVIIVYDDLDKASLYRLSDYNSDYADVKIDGKTIEQAHFGENDQYHFFVRPEKYCLGFGLTRNRLVFTTTEIITKHLIENRFEDVYTPKLMADEALIAGEIHILKTKYVGKKRDGLLPPMIERVMKVCDTEIEYFADGQGCEYNLTSNKGQNQFIGKNTVIEISEPHPNNVRQLIYELEWDWNDGDVVKHLVAFDMMNQAIGRTCGYRYSDSEEAGTQVTVVMCAPRLFKRLVEESRYYLTSARDVDKDKGFTKLSGDESIPNVIEWLLRNYVRYMVRGMGSKRLLQDWLADVRSCMNRVSVVKRMKRWSRLEDGLNTLCGEVRGENQKIVEKALLLSEKLVEELTEITPVLKPKIH